MYLFDKKSVYDLPFNGRLRGAADLRRRVPADRAGAVGLQLRARRHRDAVPALRRRRERMRAHAGERKLALPAYDQCIKASHVFNLLDARGVISVTERQAYIGRVRDARQGLLRGLARDARPPDAAKGGLRWPSCCSNSLSEEIPARMQTRAAEDLKRLVGDGAEGGGLAFDRGARAFATPRRLALVVDGLPAAAARRQRGEARAARRRARAGDRGLPRRAPASLARPGCEKRDTGKGEFWFAVHQEAGRPDGRGAARRHR